MAQPPSVGVLSQFGMNSDTTSTPAAVSEQYEILSESIATDREIVRTEGLRGTRLHPVERIRQGRQTPGGTVTLQPSYLDLVNLLPRIVGAAQSHTGYNSYTISDTVPVAFQTVCDRVAKVFTYTGCRVNRARFFSGVGQPLNLELEIEALTESVGNSGSFSSQTITAAAPFVFFDGALTLGGTSYQVQDVEVTIDWHLKLDRFVNSQTRTDLPSLDFSCMTKFTVPYTSDTVGLYDGGNGVAGVTGSLKFSTGGAGEGAAGVDLLLTFANLVFPARKSPVVPGRDEITMVLDGEARKSGSTSPLVVDLDSTP